MFIVIGVHKMRKIDLSEFARNMTFSELEEIKRDFQQLVNRFEIMKHSDDPELLKSFHIVFDIWTETYRDLPVKKEVA